MTTQALYREWLKHDCETLIDALRIDDRQKHFMRSRWLNQVMWAESKYRKDLAL